MQVLRQELSREELEIAVQPWHPWVVEGGGVVGDGFRTEFGEGEE